MTPTATRLATLVDMARAATDRAPVEEPLTEESFLPEVLDSLALAVLIGLIEDDWDFEIDDDDIEPGIFRTLGSLAAFVDRVAPARRSTA